VDASWVAHGGHRLWRHDPLHLAEVTGPTH
jgi:hypothetical protein